MGTVGKVDDVALAGIARANKILPVRMAELDAVDVPLIGLAAWWPLHAYDLPVAEDLSPNENDGTVVGCIGADDFCGQSDMALYFDGDNDLVRATTPQLDFTSEDFSVVLRIYVNALTGGHVVLCRGFNDADGYWCYIDAGGLLRFITNQTDSHQTSATADGTFSVTTWYTLGITRQGASVLIYIDGIENTPFKDNHINPASSARTLKLGIYDDETGSDFNGRLSDVKFFSRALTAAQHLAFHKRGCVAPPS